LILKRLEDFLLIMRKLRSLDGPFKGNLFDNCGLHGRAEAVPGNHGRRISKIAHHSICRCPQLGREHLNQAARYRRCVDCTVAQAYQQQIVDVELLCQRLESG
jgi:hypothetical protein